MNAGANGPSQGVGQGGAPGPRYEVNIEGRDYPWAKDTITAEEIRTLAGFESGQQIVEVDLIHNTEVTLGEDQPVALKPGHGFGKKVEFRRG